MFWAVPIAGLALLRWKLVSHTHLLLSPVFMAAAILATVHQYVHGPSCQQEFHYPSGFLPRLWSPKVSCVEKPDPQSGAWA